jgi:hypothetical protein
MLPAPLHVTLQPWLYGVALAGCSAGYAASSMIALVVPSHALVMGPSLLHGTYGVRDGYDEPRKWAVGLMTSVAQDSDMRAWWIDAINVNLGVLRYVFMVYVFLVTLGASLASVHYFGILHRRHGYSLVSTNDLWLRMFAHALAVAGSCTQNFFLSVMINRLQRVRPPEAYFVIDVQLGPIAYFGYGTLAFAGIALCLSGAQVRMI